MKIKFLYIIFLVQAFIFNFSNVITPQFLNDLQLDKVYFGYFSAVWSFGMLISSPFWGRFASKFGRKNLVIIGTLIYSLSQLGFYFISNIWVLAVLRLTSGIGVGAIVTLLLTHLIVNTSPSERAKALSYRMAFITIGMTLSYTVSGYVGMGLTKELFMYQSVLSLIFIVLIILFLKKENIQSCVYPKQFNMFESIRYVKQMDKMIIVFLFSVTLTTMTFVNLDKFLDLYIIDQGYEVSVLGNVKMVFGIVLVVTNFSIVPKLKRYLGNVYVLQTINVIMSIIILLTFINNELLVMLYSVYLAFIVLKGIYTTSEQVFLSKVVEQQDMSLFVGIRQSFTSLGMILGPIIGGYVYSYNPQNLFFFNVICLLISSVLISYMKLAPRKSRELAYSNY